MRREEGDREGAAAERVVWGACFTLSGSASLEFAYVCAAVYYTPVPCPPPAVQMVPDTRPRDFANWSLVPSEVKSRAPCSFSFTM